MSQTRTLRRSAATLFCLLLCLGATGLRAQPSAPFEDEDGVGPEIALFGGLLTPLAQLSSDPGSFATEVSTAAATGAAVTYWFGSLGVMAHGIYAPADLTVRPTRFTGPIPLELGDADFLAGTLNVAYRLRLSGAAAAVEPYFALGGGVRRLSFDPIAERDVSDSTDPAGTLSGGVFSRISETISVRFELRDVISKFDATATDESKLQNDVLVLVGLSIRP